MLCLLIIWFRRILVCFVFAISLMFEIDDVPSKMDASLSCIALLYKHYLHEWASVFATCKRELAL